MSFSDILRQVAEEYGIMLTSDQVAAFSLYQELLVSWNEKINLTAITEPREVAVKHMIDSLSCYDERFFPVGCAVVDVGTGAGFPGIPLKILRSDIKLTLVDSLNKRLTFLQDVVDQLDLKDVKLIHARAEEAGRMKEQRDRHQVAVSRAVARLNTLAELCLPFVKPGGYFIALKGAQYQEELAEAEQAIKTLAASVNDVRPVSLPGLDDRRAVIYIRKERPTPVGYPRRPGIPEKKPL